MKRLLNLNCLARSPLLIATLLALIGSTGGAATARADGILGAAGGDAAGPAKIAADARARPADDAGADPDWQREIDRVDWSAVPALRIAQAAPKGPGGAAGGDDVFNNIDEAARQSSNPLGGDFMVILNQWNVDFLQGDLTDETRHAYTHVIQPVVPIGLGGDWIWVTRPTLPIVYSAELPSGLKSDLGPLGSISTGGRRPPAGLIDFDSESGLGDVIVFSLVGTSTAKEYLGSGDLVLAGGLTTQWPSGNDEFSSDKYSAGPAGVAAFIGREYTFGALAQHWWSFADNGSSEGDDVNFTNLQYFYFLSFPGGWQVGGAPQIEVDWSATSDDRWAVPIGLGVQKTQFFGKIPVRLGVEAQYYVVDRDTLGNEWRIQFTVAPIIPNFIGKMFQ